MSKEKTKEDADIMAERFYACTEICNGIDTQDLLDGKYQLVKKENVL